MTGGGQWMPDLVREAYDALTQDGSGLQPVVEQRPGAWYLECSSDRVTVTALWRYDSRRKLRMDQSLLLVDGVSRDTVNSYTRLLQVFAAPDGAPRPAADPQRPGREDGLTRRSTRPAPAGRGLPGHQARFRLNGAAQHRH